MADVPIEDETAGGDAMEAAEPRKMYGTSSTPNFASLLPSAGDPVFDTDAQNNDEYFRFGVDQVDAMGDDLEAGE
jgi:hypothetical protein